MTNGAQEIRKLNSLRGLAALVVVVAHFSGATGWLGGYPGSGAGQFGVMLFFILSGFLMAYLYLHQPVNRGTLWRYGVARAARVIPLFSVVVAASALLPRLGIRGVLYDLPTRELVTSHLLTLSGKSILWTIPTELHFYVAFVLLWWVASRSPLAATLLAVGLISLVVALGFPRVRGETVGLIPYDLRLPQVIPYFMAGVLLGWAYRKNAPKRSHQHPAWSVVLLTVPMMYPQVFEELFGFRHALWREAWVFAAVTAVFAVVIFLVPDNSRVLSNRVGDLLGQISYSLYLLHVPVMWLVRKLALDDTVRFAIFLAASLCLAWLSFVFFERPVARAIRGRLLPPSEQAALRSPLR